MVDTTAPISEQVAWWKQEVARRPELAENPEVRDGLAQLEQLLRDNPLWGFEPNSVPQREFFTADTRVVAAFCGNQFGKCGRWDTPVRMADGTVKRLWDIREGDWVVGVNLDGSTAPARVIEWVDQGVKDCYEHVFGKCGATASFVATAEHKMLARPENGVNRIVEAQKVKHRWSAQRQLGFDPGPSDDPDEEHAMLIGLLLGDGCLTGKVPQFTCADPDILALAEIEAAKIGCWLGPNRANPIQYRVARPRHGDGPVATAHPVKQLAARHGFACYAHEKHVPSAAFGWSNAAVARLLAGLYLTDGCVTTSWGWTTVSFSSVSRPLVEGIKHLLEQRFGIYGSEIHEANRPKKKRVEYSLGIGNYGSIARFAQHIPLIGYKRDRIEYALAEWSGKHSDGATLRFREHRYVGKQQTCDIVIDHSTHLFALANGLVISNTTALVVRALRECVDEDQLPPLLRESKIGGPSQGWVVCPTEEKIYDSLLPAFQKWAPKHQLKGGVFAKAWNGNRLLLSFKNGSTIAFKTYKQHESTLGGATLHFVGYDEPPPRRHREECMTRLLLHGGFEMFAMTPLETNTGWIRRDIYKQRESPDITVIRGSMHDNRLLDSKAKEFILASYQSDLWRRAREFGDFVDVGGLVYPDFERVVIDPPTPEVVRSLDVCVAIDPGIRNAGFVYGGFDTQDVLGVFDDDLLQDATPEDYVESIDDHLGRWGISRDRVEFIIDPAARARAQVNAETVESALARLGVYCAHGQNDVSAGVQQVRSRIQHQRIWVNRDCRRLRDEIDELAAEDREDGEFKIVKRNDHIADALRYMAMHRPFDPVQEDQAPTRQLGWRPGFAPPASHLRLPAEAPPMGAMS